MLDAAIQSLKALIAASALTLVIWLLSWPSAVEKLRLYRDAKDVTAWLALTERFDGMADQVFAFGPDEVVDEEEITAADMQGGTEIRVPLKLELYWPKVRTPAVRLIPTRSELRSEFSGTMHDHARFYVVDCPVDDLPLTDYILVFTRNGESLVVPGADLRLGMFSRSELRPFYQDVRSIARPRSWDRIAPHLARYGFREHPFHLKPDHPGLINLRAENDPFSPGGGVDMFGVSLSVGTFYMAIGVILGVIAFAMIGPLLALRKAKGKPGETVWVLAIDTSRGGGLRFFEIVIAGVSWLWALAPIVVLGMQFIPDLSRNELNAGVLAVGRIGLLFAAAVFALAAIELGRCRRRRRVVPARE